MQFVLMRCNAHSHFMYTLIRFFIKVVVFIHSRYLCEIYCNLHFEGCDRVRFYRNYHDGRNLLFVEHLCKDPTVILSEFIGHNFCYILHEKNNLNMYVSMSIDLKVLA